MRFPLNLNISLISYLLKNKLHRDSKFPIVLMLEPTHICNLACDGCGRIREYKDTINRMLPLNECIEALEESGAPVVSITGGEPLMYPDIDRLVTELIYRKRHIYLCTNGLLLEESLGKFKPSVYLNFNLSIDGTEAVHDRISGRKGVFKQAIKSIKAAKKAGFRVCTNTSIYRETDMQEIEELFAYLNYLNVDGLVVAPAFSFDDIDSSIFLSRREINEKFEFIYKLSKRFRFYSSPLYLHFLRGHRSLDCTPWGNPTRNPKGWKSPCYLITDTHYKTFSELMEKTDWNRYGAGKDPRCNNCMMSCGFEPTVVREAGNRLSDIWEMIAWNLS